MIPIQVILHHSLTKDNVTVDWAAIKRFHTSWRFGDRIITPDEARSRRAAGDVVTPPWLDIGYHGGIERIAGVPQILAGRPLNIRGAHTHGQNHNSLGFCFVGNFDSMVPDEEALHLAAEYIAGWLALGGLPATRDTVKMHRDYATYKSCPGTLFPYQLFLDQVAYHLRFAD